MTGDARSLGLYGLCPTNLQSLRRRVAVQRHILRLKRCRLVAVLSEDTAESGGDDALANIAARTHEHQWM